MVIFFILLVTMTMMHGADNFVTFGAFLDFEAVNMGAWDYLCHRSQEEKNEALQMANDRLCPYEGWKSDITRILHYGANPQSIKKPFLVGRSVTFNDFDLTKLLLKKGANVHECSDVAHREFPVYNIKNVAIAQLLEQYGAFRNEKISALKLFDNVMLCMSDPDLIQYYKKLGFSPLEGIDSSQDSPLFTLINNSKFQVDKIVKKATLFLDGLNAEEVYTILKKKNREGRNVFDCIRKTMQNEYCDADQKKALIKLDLFLKAKISLELVEQPSPVECLERNCPICLDIIQEPTVTICMHLFCKGCLEESTKYSNACPMCRTTLYS